MPHEARQLLQTNTVIGFPGVERPLEVPLTDNDRHSAQAMLTAQFPSAPILLGLHLSSKWLGDGWSGADIVRLLEDILAAIPGSCLVVTCGPADRSAVSAMLTYLTQRDGLSPVDLDSETELVVSALDGRIILLGNMSFRRWTALLSHCRLLITPDTGALHLAAALRKPIVAVYEGVDFHRSMYQWAPWKVPFRMVLFSSYSETAPAILQGIHDLLADQATPEKRA